nr:immunoglobulin heavy chain junction region [Mus musculus]MBK4197456.1 immunoglobulin heavy chain junction region [Mus musculus]
CSRGDGNYYGSFAYW